MPLCKENNSTMSHCNIGDSDYMTTTMKIDKSPPGLKLTDFEEKSLLIVDDDDPLRMRLARAMEKKGFQVKDAKTVENAIKMVVSAPQSLLWLI